MDGNVGNSLRKERDEWSRPSRRDIRKGQIIEIWSPPKTDPDRKFEGLAKLIEADPGWRGTHGLPYLAYERPGRKFSRVCYIWTWERWLIEWVESDRFKVGDRTYRKIHFFLCRDWRYPSGYVRKGWDEGKYEDDKLEKISNSINKEHFAHDEEE